MIKYQTGVEVV